MNLIEQLNRAIGYIELNLTDAEALSSVANVTSYSSYHFQRIFNYLTDMPLSEYIRKRKMSVAVVDLQRGNKVIDVAVKYGYNSADSFARAFERQHGFTPTIVRQDGVKFQIYPPLTFQIQIKGVQKMTCKIETKSAFEMFGVYGEISSDMEKAFEEVPMFRKQCDDDGSVDEMNNLLGEEPDTMLHAVLYDHTETTFKYMICQHVPEAMDIPKRFTILHVPAMTWAIFSVDDCEMQNMWRRIYAEWLPTSGYNLVGDINFEMYYGKADNPRGEIWIPVEPQ
ncbi:MAG: AraC family transcriptional regulator [Clostridiales bacterium]|nr:AraC family transcriptional regulator [uncultured Anaerosporobacter sp.]MBS5932173.1 AraC family transcriptional regulator [Clostridiales bacterium]